MKIKLLCFSIVLMGLVRADARAQDASGRPATPPQTVTLVGCVQREVDVLRTSPGNLGLANEFILVRTSVKPDSATGKAAAAATGTAGRATEDAAAASGPYGRIYRLSGDQEAQLKDHVAEQVEIAASFETDKDAQLEAQRDVAPSKTASTPDRRPEAKDVPKMVIQSIRPLGTGCASAGRK
jgi:hypothetical protein